MINNNKNVLLVDLVILYSTSFLLYEIGIIEHFQIKKYLTIMITQDDIFMEKYKKLFFDKILKICRKNSIEHSNIVFAIDCKHTTIWRNNVYQEYKGTRQESHKRSKFYAFGLFKLVIEELLPEFSAKHNNTVLKVEECEADDIVANIVIHLENERKSNMNGDEFDIDNYDSTDSRKIFILASDTDYIQLCDSNVILIDMNSNYLNQKYFLLILIRGII